MFKNYVSWPGIICYDICHFWNIAPHLASLAGLIIPEYCMWMAISVLLGTQWHSIYYTIAQICLFNTLFALFHINLYGYSWIRGNSCYWTQLTVNQKGKVSKQCDFYYDCDYGDDGDYYHHYYHYHYYHHYLYCSCSCHYHDYHYLNQCYHHVFMNSQLLIYLPVFFHLFIHFRMSFVTRENICEKKQVNLLNNSYTAAYIAYCYCSHHPI